MRYEMPLLKRLLTKVVHDVLPAALASIIGGFLFTHLQLGWGQERVTAPAAPASAEMMQLLRDEHGLIVSFVQARIADEKKQLTANANAGDGAAEPQPGASTAGSRPSAVAMAAAKAHGKHPLTAAALPPLLIARVQQHEEIKSAVRRPFAARQDDRDQRSRRCRHPTGRFGDRRDPDVDRRDWRPDRRRGPQSTSAGQLG